MSIVLGIPCLNRFDWLEKCIMSASQGSIAPDRFVVVDNSCGAIARDGMRLSDIFGSDVEVITPAYNLGVAASWNRIVQACGPDDQLIISNDDILFAKDTIERLLGAAEQAPGAGTVSAIDGQKFSLFYLRRRCYDAVGPFDEAFYPGYFEDNDFKERAERAGWQLISAVSNVEHGGSQTRAAMDEQALARSHQQFKKNAIYFVAKWGNLPHEGPLYEAPFDL
jgi:GT2 family glycosyltransferase